MPSAPLPPNQGERLWAICSYSNLNILREQPRQRYTELNRSSTSGRKLLALRQKTRLLFAMILTGFLGVTYVASAKILSNLKQAEEQNARKLVQEVLGVFAQIQNDLSSDHGLSTWVDRYTSIENANKQYASNLIPEQMALANIDLVLYVHSSGRIVFGTGFDPKTEKTTVVPEGLRNHLSTNVLLQHSNPNKLAGIVLLSEGPMLISSRSISTSKGKGPIRGTLIFGRYLDAKEIQKLARITRLSLSVHRLNEVQLPPDFQAVSSFGSGKQIVVRRLSEQSIAGYVLLTDIYSKPALLLHVQIPRDNYKQSRSILYYLVGSILIVGLAFIGITLRLLEQLLLFQHERREREEHYRVVIGQTSEGIFLVDADSKRLIDANAAFYNLLDYTSEEVLGLTLYDVVADSRENIDHQLQHIRIKRHYLTSRWRYCCKSGSLIDVEGSANLISRNERDTFCIVIRNITEYKQAEKALSKTQRRLSWRASHDPLTRLINRNEFEQRLEQAVIDAKTSDHQHTLCYLDIDRFKMINDTCGHVAGDALLRQVSTLLKTELRKTDNLGRVGGDEFGVLIYLRKSDILARLGDDEFGLLLHQCPLKQALQIADMLRERIHEFRFEWQKKTFYISVSIGLVVINADQTLTNFLSAADVACHTAKNKGRNCMHVYQHDDIELAQQRGEMQWVSRITRALAENRFRLYQQRIVPIDKTKSDEHCEVLLRLEDETGKIVSPMEFIPAAERYDIMHLIDRWVISTLFTYLEPQYQDWDYSQAPNCPTFYAVNLSGASINSEKFINFVQEQFANSRIPPSIICFEITETVAINNLEKAAQFINDLKTLGCHIALDDFGSGMSSFAYLRNLPIDYLKIDGVFIRDIVKDAIAAGMVEAIIHIASVMGIQTTAEYVENDFILTKLKTLGVDYAQGYGIAKPCPL